jgi:RND family efflux transporter MFP subunit
MRTARKILAFTVVLGATLTLSACGGSEESTTLADDGSAVPVQVAEAEAQSMPQRFRYTGTVQGVRRVPLSTKLMGRVARLTVDEGDRVRQGETLVRIDSNNVQAQKRQVQAQLREARANLQNVETNFERIQALHERESATQKEFDDMKTRYESAQAQVEAMENRLAEINDMLSYAAVTAPIDGYVVEKRIEEGALAAPGHPLLVVETIDALKVVAQVPEYEVNRFAEGDTVAVEIGALDRTLRGQVTEINPSGSPSSRLFRVQVVLMDELSGIKSGMYAQVLLQKGETPTTTVPESSLVQRGQLTGLYTVSDDDRAVLRWVRLGSHYDGRVEILSGLRAGERYIARADGRLQDGQKVTAQN